MHLQLFHGVRTWLWSAFDVVERENLLWLIGCVLPTRVDLYSLWLLLLTIAIRYAPTSSGTQAVPVCMCLKSIYWRVSLPRFLERTAVGSTTSPPGFMTTNHLRIHGLPRPLHRGPYWRWLWWGTGRTQQSVDICPSPKPVTLRTTRVDESNRSPSVKLVDDDHQPLMESSYVIIVH